MLTGKSLRKIEFFWHVFVLLIIIGAFSVQWRGLYGGSGNQIEGNLLERYLLIILYGLSITPLLFQLPKLIYLFTRTYMLWLLVLLALLSFSWSALPNVSLRRAISILLATLYATILFFRFKPRELMNILFVVFTVIILSSLIVIVFFPDIGIMGGGHSGSWQGVMNHKNAFGRISLLAMLIFYHKFLTVKGIRKTLILLLIVISTFMLIKSNSATAFVLLGILGLAVWMIRTSWRLRKDWPIFILFIVSLMLILSLLLISEYTSILELLGRDTTLTGRLPLWKNIMPYLIEKFWFGYGYRVFWVDPTGPYPLIWSAVHWQPLHAHNGYIDLLLSFGFSGLIIVLIVIVGLFINAFRCVMRNRNFEIMKTSFEYFILLFSVVLIFNNFTETMVLNSDINNAFYWIITTYAYFQLITNRKNKGEYFDISQA